MKPAASPLRRVKRTTWSAPWARATSAVPSVEPSSMIRTSTTSIPGIARGMAASVAGSVASSFRQGIWTMSFMRASATRRPVADTRNRSTGPGSAVNAGAPGAPPRPARRSRSGTARRCPGRRAARPAPVRSASSSRAAGPAGGAAGASAGVMRRNPSSTGAAAASAAIQPAISRSEPSRRAVRPEVEGGGIDLQRPRRDRGGGGGSGSRARGSRCGRSARLSIGRCSRVMGPFTTSSRSAPAIVDGAAGRAHAQRLAVEAAAERRLRLRRRAHRRLVEGEGGDAVGGQPLPLRRGVARGRRRGAGGSRRGAPTARPRRARCRRPRRSRAASTPSSATTTSTRSRQRGPGSAAGGAAGSVRGSRAPVAVVSTEDTSAPQYRHCGRATATGRRQRGTDPPPRR